MGKHNKDKKPLPPGKREQQVNQSLSAIFRTEGGAMPDLTKLERHRTPWVMVVGIGLGVFFLILLLAAWTGFAIFKPFTSFKGKGLEITVDGPQQIALGQETTYFINWQNSASEPLATADIRVSFPSDFTPTVTEPKPTGTGLVWRLGSVPFGGRGTITLKGIFAGALGTQTAIQAVGTYRPASFNSDFEALSTRQIEYADTVLDGTIEGPAKSLPGDKIRLAYHLQNRGAEPMSGLEARITLPDGFVRDASSSGAVLDGAVMRMTVGSLAAGASTTLVVTGSFASGVSGNVPIHAEVGRIGLNGEFQPTLKSDATIAVLAGDLLLKLAVNGSDVDRSIGFGEPLRLSIGYENTAIEDLKGVSIRLIIDPIVPTSTQPAAHPAKKAPSSPPFLDWSQLEDASSGTVSGGAVTWDKSQVGVFEKLLPQQDGSIDLSVPTILHATTSTPIGFTILVEATMASVGTTPVSRTIRTAPMTFRFRTDADLAAEARYYSEEGAPLGTGPLPPVVGQTTTYHIGWALTKTTHELSGIRVSATLPQSVAWPDKSIVSAGDISYDQASRTVSWTLNRMPADVDEAHADFDVQLTPSEFDVGRFADLVNETKFEATDVQINEPIVRTKPALTTELQNDEGAKNKGVVRKP
jgi:hypothetical protein